MSPHISALNTQLLEKCVYFGQSGKVYSLRLSCAVSDSAAFKTGFDKILETVRIAPAPAMHRR